MSHKVVQFELQENEVKAEKCTSTENEKINTAMLVVNNFWSEKYNYEKYFSKSYRKYLRDNKLSIRQKHKYIFQSERVWVKQVYEKATLQLGNYVQISVLSTWSQEGYRGVSTIIFGLIYEDGKWKIDDLMY